MRRARISAETHGNGLDLCRHQCPWRRTPCEDFSPVHFVGDSPNGYTERKLVAERFYAASHQE